MAGTPAQGEQRPTFGPYVARVMDASIVRDVKVDEEGNIFLQLVPEQRDEELRVKISLQPGAEYRKWWHGGYELVSPAQAGKEPLGWTDRVQTSAPFIEYWMNGALFLHLERVSKS